MICMDHEKLPYKYVTSCLSNFLFQMTETAFGRMLRKNYYQVTITF